eukprot:11409704-Alexandrium_andersonii.AAC.1
MAIQPRTRGHYQCLLRAELEAAAQPIRMPYQNNPATRQPDSSRKTDAGYHRPPKIHSERLTSQRMHLRSAHP